jgi:hypothetical protein
MIQKLISFCVSLAFPAEIQQRFFHLTKNVILKASKYIDLVCKQNNSEAKNNSQQQTIKTQLKGPLFFQNVVMD